jgi:O6-methylguanine-DNA--protein-cysteine methyltransferase
MGCGCGSTNRENQVQQTYVHTAPTGEQKTYKSEVEAIAAQHRVGGAYRVQTT